MASIQRARAYTQAAASFRHHRLGTTRFAASVLACRIQGAARSTSTDASVPWGLVPLFSGALPPAVVCALDKAVLQGLLNRPTWQKNDAAASARAYADVLATPRDGMMLHAALTMTLGTKVGEPDAIDNATPAAPAASTSTTETMVQETRDKLALASLKSKLSLPAPPEAATAALQPADGLLYLNTPHIHEFLASSTDLFSHVFSRGLRGVLKDISERGESNALLQELTHEKIYSKLVKLAEQKHSAVETDVQVIAARIVDFQAVWDGSTRAEDVESGNYGARELGHTITIHSKVISGLITRLLSNVMHAFQMQPVRQLTARATVAFVCVEKQDGEAMGQSLPEGLFESGDAAPQGVKAATEDDKNHKGIRRKRAVQTGKAEAAAASTDAIADGEDTGVPPLVAQRLSSALPERILHVVPLLVRCSGPISEAVEMGSGRDASTGVKATVHTITFEASGKASHDYAFKPLRYLLPAPPKCTQGWKIVDIDGHFAREPVTFSPTWATLTQKAQERTIWEMENAVEGTLPGGMDTVHNMGKLSSQLDRITKSLSITYDLIHASNASAKEVSNAGIKRSPERSVASLMPPVVELLAFASAFAGEVGKSSSTTPWAARVALERELEKADSTMAATIEHPAWYNRMIAEVATETPFLSVGGAVVQGKVVMEPRTDLSRLFRLINDVETIGSDIPMGIRMQLKILHRGFVNFNELVQRSFIAEMITHVAVPAVLATVASIVQCLADCNVNEKHNEAIAALQEKIEILNKEGADYRIFQVAMTSTFEPAAAVNDSSSDTGEVTVSQRRENFYSGLLSVLNDLNEFLPSAELKTDRGNEPPEQNEEDDASLEATKGRKIKRGSKSST
jgi:hypothetical protein